MPTIGVYRDGSRHSWLGKPVRESVAEHTIRARLMFCSWAWNFTTFITNGDSSGMYQVEDVSRGRVLVQGGVRDRSDVMRSVMMRGRRPFLELRGGAILGSDSEFRSTARAKFKVSKDVEICEARTLSTAIRLFTNSGESHMASVSNARTTQAKGSCETTQPGQNEAHTCCIKELSIFYLVPSFRGRGEVQRDDMLA